MAVDREQTFYADAELVAETRQRVENILKQKGIVLSGRSQSRIGKAVANIAEYITRASEYPPFGGAILAYNGKSLGLLEIINTPPAVSGDPENLTELGVPSVAHQRLTELSSVYLSRNSIRHPKISAVRANDPQAIDHILRGLSKQTVSIGRIDPIRPYPVE